MLVKPWLVWGKLGQRRLGKASVGQLRPAWDKFGKPRLAKDIVGQLWLAWDKFGQPRLAKAVLDLNHEFHLRHQHDVLDLPDSPDRTDQTQKQTAVGQLLSDILCSDNRSSDNR